MVPVDEIELMTIGITVPTIKPGCRPVQIKLAVDDLDTSVAFYQNAFGLQYRITRRTRETDYPGFQFGEYGEVDDFFLLHMLDNPGLFDRPARMTFGLLVDDLDSVHASALDAGAIGAVAPHDDEGMPRSSAVKDPSGNWIWLYQGGVASRPVQVKLAVDDAQASIAFYGEAFGLHYEVTRHTEEKDYFSFQFGEYGHDDFFLLHLLDDPADLDCPPGSSTFGLLIDDLDAVHARAVAAGATHLIAPHDPEGMPRCSTVKDLSGNRIWLYQG